MYIFTNALKNIWRNKGKNLLFALIALAIIIISTMGLLIRGASSELITNYRNQYGSKVTLSPDFDKVGPGKQQTGGPPSPKQVVDFGKSSLIQKSIYTANIPVNPDNLKMVDQDADNGGGKTIMSSGDSMGSPEGKDVTMPTGKILGYNSPSISDDFTSGKRQIREGKMYSAKDDCLISEDVAKLNNLKIGDKITVKGMDKKSTPSTLRISGIYADATTSKQDMPFKDAFSNRKNEIITSQDTALGLSIFGNSGTMEADYYLKNPDMLDDFRKEIVKKGLPDTYKVTTDEAAYRKATAPLESLQKVTTIFLILVVALGAIVLLLLSIMSMRSRRYEIGVLRAIGMKKGKVSLGLVSEVVVIVALCLAVGLGIGASATQPVADSMLSGQVSSYEKEEEAKKKSPGEGGMVIVGPNTSEAAEVKPPKIETRLTGQTAGQIVGVSLGIVLLSSLVSVATTNRWEPRRILSEGN
ncbi:ABC transporter permease [Bombiscardovia apis]|uniref:ABC transporter permease n=1 Tax=Bombiscardovia apis TaxID=2932182 RepID=A0ABN6SIW1_9BIFI|nr:FtsX-like permease family protein [Bombiscardovia apis]BDR54891.1 ABC transporter permease [Bombiscardovia apis]